MEVQFIDDTSDICCCEGFIMRRGVSDLYVYVILEGISTSGDIHMKQTRVVCRPNGNQFSYGYVTDDMQGEMPSVATMKWLNRMPRHRRHKMLLIVCRTAASTLVQLVQLQRE